MLGQENHYTLHSEAVLNLILQSRNTTLEWELDFESMQLDIEGAFPTPRTDELGSTAVSVTTTPKGVVLDAVARGIVSPGIGARYVERAAAAFFPRLPDAAPGEEPTWSDTLTVTEVLQGVTTEMTTVLYYTASEPAALAAREVLPVEYSGAISVVGAGTIGGSRVELVGSGHVSGHYLYDPMDRIFDLHEQEQVVESTLTLAGSGPEVVSIPSRQVLRSRAERLFSP